MNKLIDILKEIINIANVDKFISAEELEQDINFNDKAIGEESDISTGFKPLDKYILDLHSFNLIAIASGLAMGKTSFAIDLARNITFSGGKKCMFFSLEWSERQIAARILQSITKISSDKIRFGNYSTDEKKIIIDAINKLSDAELYIDDSSCITVSEIKQRIEQLGYVDCVIIDYLALIKYEKKLTRRIDETNEISLLLKALARDLSIPVICTVPLRWQEQRIYGRCPDLDDLKAYGRIFQDADVICILYGAGKEFYEISDAKSDDEARLIISKNGCVNYEIVEMKFDKKAGDFIEVGNEKGCINHS